MVIYFYAKDREVRLEYTLGNYTKYDDRIEIIVADRKNPEEAIIHRIPLKDIKEFRTDLQDAQMRRRFPDHKARNSLAGV